MSNKPVAWTDEINTFVLDKDYQQFPKSLQHGMIPLYTHPVKELTDEEIGDFEYQIIRACGLSTANSDINPIGLRQIIKAILRKASEI